MPKCAQCGREYDYPPGRGGRSPYCESCKLERRAALQELRSLRHAVRTVVEWTEAVGPTVLAWKQEVTRQQDAKCKWCGKQERLYLGRDEQGLIGLCVGCHDRWREERSGRDDGVGAGDRAGEPVSVPGA